MTKKEVRNFFNAENVICHACVYAACDDCPVNLMARDLEKDLKRNVYAIDHDNYIQDVCKEMGVKYTPELVQDIYLRQEDLEDYEADVKRFARACVAYAKACGTWELIHEENDGNIWDYYWRSPYCSETEE